uniref:Uncharacterized protein n=1 Tax=Romanomermis culicivorax TaxID=13658 RepID=A0A915HGN2_ROMCU
MFCTWVCTACLGPYNYLFNPSFGTWNSYQFVSARTAHDRVSAAYAFLTLKDKDNRVSTTNSIIDDLRSFVTYKNRKNFNREMASELAQFWNKYDRCRSMIEPA